MFGERERERRRGSEEGMGGCGVKCLGKGQIKERKERGVGGVDFGDDALAGVCFKGSWLGGNSWHGANLHLTISNEERRCFNPVDCEVGVPVRWVGASICIQGRSVAE